jgi:gliding motility-associated-like protein
LYISATYKTILSSNIRQGFVVVKGIMVNKLFIDCISKVYLLGVLMFAICLNANANNYTTISNGSYNDCSIWDNGCPDNNIQLGDTVFINHVITASSSMNIFGVLIINASGNFSMDNDMDLNDIGYIFVEGIFGLDAELNLNGFFYNSGYSVIDYLHNDGYVCNSGTIKVPDRVNNHGGLIECGGTLLTCELDMEENDNAIDVTGTATAELLSQNVCCEDPGNPNPFDDLIGSYTMDSLTVSICVEILKPNAGDDASSDICNSAGSIIDLNNLLSTDANLGGIFEEITSSGSFDAATGVFTTEGLTAGTYDFIYIANGYNSTSDTASLMMTVKPTSLVIVDMLVCGSEIPLSWNGLSISTSGSHSVTFTNSSGCDSLITLHLTIEELEVPVVSSNSPVSCQGELLTFSVDEISGAQYEWFGPMGYSSQNTFNELEFYQDMSGSYGVYYTLNSCVSDITYIDLVVENVFEITDFDFPNVLTANGDGINEYIDIEKYVGKCENFTLTVRDRWGVVVYNQERGDMAFSGKALTGDKLPEGVYFYTFAYGKEVVKNFLHIIH